MQHPASFAVPSLLSTATPASEHPIEPRSADGQPRDQPPIALTVREAAGLLRLDPRTIRAMVLTGELEGNHRGHAIRVSHASVVEWLRGKRRVSRSTR